MAFMAGDVKLIESLKQPLSGYATAAKGSLQDALGRITARSKEGQQATGRVQGNYGAEQIGQAGMMSERGIEDRLNSVLGNASYGDTLAQKKFEQDMALAKRIGKLNRPSTLTQVITGLGGAVDTGVQAKGLYDALNRPSSRAGNVQFGLSSNPYQTNLDSIRGYAPRRNELFIGDY